MGRILADLFYLFIFFFTLYSIIRQAIMHALYA